ncbi:MAG: hypothetical protein ACK4SY_10505 [Pyrobaculum sp.]
MPLATSPLKAIACLTEVRSLPQASVAWGIAESLQPHYLHLGDVPICL